MCGEGEKQVTTHRQGADSASYKLGVVEQGMEVAGWLKQRSEKREESNAINYVRDSGKINEEFASGKMEG